MVATLYSPASYWEARHLAVRLHVISFDELAGRRFVFDPLQAMEGDGSGGAHAEVDMDVVYKIVNQIEESDFKKWEYSGSKILSPDEQSLAQAQRFMAAQSFLLSWQQGKVPTGWRRPRRLTDFEGESPHVLAAAKAVAQARMEERNEDATKRINEMRASACAPRSQEDIKPISKKELGDLKNAYSKFSSDLYDINTALANASSTIADLVLRTQALVEQDSKG